MLWQKTRSYIFSSMVTNISSAMVCPSPMKTTSNGVFQGDNPLDFALPLVILQICLVLFVTRSLAVVLKPLRQPRVIAEVVGGILLGPSALGRNKTYLQAMFPSKSLPVLETIANIGLLFFLFLAGLELDPRSLRQTGKKALCIAIAGISLPFALGIGSSLVLRETIAKGENGSAFLVFMGVALSITAFPVLARILAELKILTTNIGRMAMSAAAVNDVAAWILLALAIVLSGSGHSPLIAVWVLLSGCGFVIVSTLIFSPLFKWMNKQCSNGEPIREIFICVTLACVLAAGFVTDFIGIHAMFGAFVVGILVPKDGSFAGALTEKVEDLVSGLFLPLYFVSSGLKTDITTIQGLQSWGLLVLVIVAACIGKIVGTVGVSLSCKIPAREALTLGVLMNSKGLVELIVLNVGKDRKVLNDQTFAIMVLMAVFTTFITTPLVISVYKPSRKEETDYYKHRKIERENPDTELRVLACFHSARNIPALINLLEASRGSEKRDGLCVYAVHLMELSERSSAIIMVNKARKNGLLLWNKGRRSDPEQVVVAFEAYQQLSRVSIRPMTAISSISTMHEDICTTAGSKRASIIILPYHKHQRIDGSLEITRSSFRLVNEKVLDQAPCSVGILVDRGLGGSFHIPASHVSYLITVLFIGGPDDRESLAYGTRMAEHPGINLTVVHFSVHPTATAETVKVDINQNSSSLAESEEGEEEYFEKYKQKVANNNSITFSERQVKNYAEITNAIRGLRPCNLFLAGRSPSGEVALALSTGSECPEIGPVGSLLTSPDFPTTASILVVQQKSSA